ncbi:MiaB/RimO family radical SAM methylthiotransferase [Patescibacteria group bacterium]|nr:MiaB/RimO family radical SAM methylthiotransferase [Patescibacteria group bacterium]
MQIYIKTLGCKSNRYESDRLLEDLSGEHDVFELNEGVSNFSGIKPDILIVNTCTVTHVADRKSRQAVRSFKSKFPGVEVLVFGCGSNVGREDYEQMVEVDRVFGDREELTEYLRRKEDYCGTGVLDDGMRTRGLIKIQDGCENFCSYCVIPLARGPEYSYPSKDILAEARAKEAAGYKEVVLTGINIGQWKEGDMDLADLFEMLILGTSKLRFRVSSIEPKNFSKKLFRLFAGGRLCPHMHISLQSGCDDILKRMKRNYNCQEFMEVCKKFKEAHEDMTITTDIIVGFPGETDEMFEKTVSFVKMAGFLKVHVFPYSRRRNTAAFMMKEQISDELKKLRAQRLRSVADEVSSVVKSGFLGREMEVLVEEGALRGVTPNYLFVKLDRHNKIKPNDIISVRLDKDNIL